MIDGTKITIENIYGVYSVETADRDLTFDALVETLIEPVCLAMGYHPDTVKEFLNA